MIAVIADDFTGAAEIGGVGLKYGQKVVIGNPEDISEDTDLLIVAANTRSLNKKEASFEIETITKKILKKKPEYVFKKQDSVLRGNIVAEIIAQLNVTGKKRAIMIAGNPPFNRVIQNGIYYINGTPLAETSFVKDPDFPVMSSVVTDIISSDKIQVYSQAVDAPMPDTGIIIGDVRDKKEMEQWAEKIDEASVIAGGAGFFDVIMSKQFNAVEPDKNNRFVLGDTTLFVFGSKYPKKELISAGFIPDNSFKLNMPDEIYENHNFNRELLVSWAEKISKSLKEEGKAIITVEQDYSREKNLSERIRKNISEVVKLVTEKVKLTDLILEGGATTCEVLKAIGISKLYPNRFINSGIIQMKTPEYTGMTITTKPGSYPWPEGNKRV